MDDQKSGVSIVLCCYNGADRLERTLAHLLKQEIDGFDWEIIVVDNASVDNTFAVAESVLERGLVKYKVISEAKPGLSNARRTGIENAKYNYIIFCDDDNWLCSDYVAKVFQIMEADSSIGAVGGQGTPNSEVEIPNWFYTFAYVYATGVQAIESGDISQRGFVWGAGLGIRTKILKQVFSAGINSELTGRNGSQLSSGDDTEISFWVLASGHKLWYSEDLKFTHFIPKNRLTIPYLEGLLEGFHAANPVVMRYSYFLKARKMSAFFRFFLIIITNLALLLQIGKVDQRLQNHLHALNLALKMKLSFD